MIYINQIILAFPRYIFLGMVHITKHCYTIIMSDNNVWKRFRKRILGVWKSLLISVTVVILSYRTGMLVSNVAVFSGWYNRFLALWLVRTKHVTLIQNQSTVIGDKTWPSGCTPFSWIQFQMITWHNTTNKRANE